MSRCTLTYCVNCCIFFLMLRQPPRSTRTDTLFPTRRSSDLASHARAQGWDATRFTYEAEADTGKRGGASQSEKRGGFGLARSLLGSLDRKSTRLNSSH